MFSRWKKVKKKRPKSQPIIAGTLPSISSADIFYQDADGEVFKEKTREIPPLKLGDDPARYRHFTIGPNGSHATFDSVISANKFLAENTPGICALIILGIYGEKLVKPIHIEALAQFGERLLMNSHVTQLELRECHLGESFVQQLCKAYSVKKLISLSFVRCSCEKKTAKILGTALSSVGGLQFSMDNCSTVLIPEILDACSKVGVALRLSTLDLSNMSIKRKLVNAVLKGKNLVDIKLTSIKGVRQVAFRLLGRMLRTHKALHRFSLDGTPLSTKTIVKMLDELKYMNDGKVFKPKFSLSMKDTGMDDVGILALANFYKHYQKCNYLEVTGDYFSDIGNKIFCARILALLEMEYLFLRRTSFLDDGLFGVLNLALDSAPHLRSMVLTPNGLKTEQKNYLGQRANVRIY